jgi:hypothetical protein
MCVNRRFGRLESLGQLCGAIGDAQQQGSQCPAVRAHARTGTRNVKKWKLQDLRHGNHLFSVSRLASPRS